jgi:subtilisin family serine protease
MSVAATNGDDKVTGYSQSGKVDVAAPGGSQSGPRIFSTNKGGGYGWGSGTSQAAAHVTGALALVLQKNPKMSYEEAMALLQETARDLGEPVERPRLSNDDVVAEVSRTVAMSEARRRTRHTTYMGTTLDVGMRSTPSARV